MAWIPKGVVFAYRREEHPLLDSNVPGRRPTLEGPRRDNEEEDEAGGIIIYCKVEEVLIEHLLGWVL